MTARTGLSRGWGAVCGLLTAAVAMGVAQLIAGLSTPASSPVVAVGEAAIGSTPIWLKDWAVSTFGQDDKNVLVGGVLVIVFLYAMLIGVLATRRLWLGFAGLTVFAALGLAAALTRPEASASWVWPTLIGAAVGAFALYRLIESGQESVAEAAAARTERESRFAESQRPITFGATEPGEASGAGGAGEAAGSGPDVPADTGTGETGWLRVGGSPDGDGDGEAAGDGSGRPVPAGVAGSGGSDIGAEWAARGAVGPLDAGTIGSTARRSFLWTAGLTVAAAAVGEYAGRSFSTRKNVSAAQAAIKFPKPTVPAPPLPRGINPPIPGLSSFITPNGQFYRVDTAIIVPEVDPSSWQLRIHGMVAREVVITFDELLRRPLIEDYVTLCCVSNPVGGPYIGNAKWLGASYASLIREAGPLRGADQLLCTSVDGFTSGTPIQMVLDEPKDSLIAVAMNGTVLPTDHGFPARLVVPGLYGYVSACKWVVDIEVTTFANAVAYWAQNGWSQQAPIKTESRIDVPGSGSQVNAGTVTVAGVAWAQHKGIEAVEVQVDSGPWQLATLAPVPDLDTWRQWYWHWTDAKPGNHTIQARATDKTGYTQTSLQEPVAPNGASGYPQITVSVT
jgi:DMSO/TMAO reductase YedYZ molybdopterin-dependent catalytic subunit